MKRASMSRFLVRRLLLVVPIIGIVGVVTFGLSRLAPGDPAQVFLGEGATPEQVARLRGEWGLDEPLPVQFSIWAWNMLKGDLGDSLRFRSPVIEVVGQHLGPTISIIGLAVLLIVAVGVPAGLAAARWRGTWIDRSSMSLAFAGVSVPEFWLGMLLTLVFAVGLGLFPVSGYVPVGVSFSGWLSSIVLPSVALALGQIGLLARMVRDSVINTSNEQWVVALRARGVSEASILLKHALKSAAVPALTVIGNSMAALITGAVVVEAVFNIHGIGWLTVNSTLQRDYPLVQGTVLLAALGYVLINLTIDALYAVVDPRIRAGGA